MTTVLITGGAGFLGCHLVRALAPDHEVVVLDSLSPQVHGPAASRPPSLEAEARLVVGDVRDPGVVEPLVDSSDVVVHLAASTGVGQSMYEIRDYFDINVTGTAVVLEACRRARRRPGRIVLASSRAIYGEGGYNCPGCGAVVPSPRTAEALAAGCWDPPCPRCGGACQAAATSEQSPSAPASIYAISKLSQEQAVLTVGRVGGIDAVALRLFNVYGPGQSPSNPYTGVINAFIARGLNGSACDVYEDGRATRDFVHVEDVTSALAMAARGRLAPGVINVGTGRATTLHEAASIIADALGSPSPVVNAAYRLGDVRHSWADVGAATELGVVAQVDVEDGLRDLAAQVEGQSWVDETARVEAELLAHGLGGRADG